MDSRHLAFVICFATQALISTYGQLYHTISVHIDTPDAPNISEAVETVREAVDTPVFEVVMRTLEATPDGCCATSNMK